MKEEETYFAGSKLFINKSKIRFWFIVAAVFVICVLTGISKQVFHLFQYISR
jgi:hypothetical protein